MTKFCYSCMNEYDGEEICPICGADTNIKQDLPMLPLKYLLNKRYLIGQCISKGGDGFTYIGNDIEQSNKVYVREFFPQPLAKRINDLKITIETKYMDEYEEYLADFQDMAKKLMKLNDQPAIMPVYDVIWENNTIYYVTEFIENVTLDEAISTARGKGIAWSGVKTLFDLFLDGIASMHRIGIVHRGISPNTILLCSDGKLRLSGFSIPAARMQGRGIQPCLEEGFAAPEQLVGSPYPDSSSDIYSICATIFYALTGIKYISKEVVFEYPQDLPGFISSAIHKGMQPDPEQRFANVDEMKAALNDERIAGSSFAGAIHLTEELEQYKIGEEQPKMSEKHKSSFRVIMLSALFGVLVLAIVVVLALYFLLDVNIFTANWFGSSSTISKQYSSLPEESSKSTIAFVPDLKGFNIKDILAEYATSDKFTIETEMSPFNDVPRNTIMSQSPEAGAPSPGKTTIILKVSRGREYVAMPEIVGLPLDQALTKLTELGLEMTVIDLPTTVEVDTNGDSFPDAMQTVTPGVVWQCQYKKDDIVHAESVVLVYALPLPASASGTSTASGVSVTNGVSTTSTSHITSSVTTSSRK